MNQSINTWNQQYLGSPQRSSFFKQENRCLVQQIYLRALERIMNNCIRMMLENSITLYVFLFLVVHRRTFKGHVPRPSCLTKAFWKTMGSRYLRETHASCCDLQFHWKYLLSQNIIRWKCWFITDVPFIYKEPLATYRLSQQLGEANYANWLLLHFIQLRKNCGRIINPSSVWLTYQEIFVAQWNLLLLPLDRKYDLHATWLQELDKIYPFW